MAANTLSGGARIVSVLLSDALNYPGSECLIEGCQSESFDTRVIKGVRWWNSSGPWHLGRSLTEAEHRHIFDCTPKTLTCVAGDPRRDSSRTGANSAGARTGDGG